MGKSRLLREFERVLADRPDAAHVPHRALPPVRHRHRLLGARRGAARRVRDRGHRLRRRGVAQAARPTSRPVREATTSTSWASRASAGRADRPAARNRGARRAGAPGEDPERLRESFFSALRSGMEAWASQRPLVLAFEDIHWADDGMLDAIEHLAQWVRAPLMLVCLARDELLDRRPAWGGGRRSATQLLLDPLSPGDTRALVAALIPGGEDVVPEVVERSGGNPLFAEEMARRIARRAACAPPSCPTPCRRCSPRASTRSSPSSGAWCSRPPWWDARSGRPRWRRWPRPRAASSAGAHALQEKDILAPGAEGRLAGERELAFKHVLIRDVAYGMLPKAVRSRKHFEVGAFIEERAGDRTDEMVALLAEHYGRAASLGREGALAADELAPMRERARALPGGGRRRRRAPLLQPRGGRALPPRAHVGAGGDRAAARPRGREARRRVAAPRPRGRGDRRLAGVPRLAPRPGGPRARGRPAPQDRRRALAQGRAPGRDRALPARHQPAEGRPAADRAGAPLRGGGLALPAHRRQHARDLRLREGAAAGRAARRDARGQPRPRHLRTRVRAHRRHREGAPEPRARGGAGSRAADEGRTTREPRHPGAVRARPPPRDLRGRHGRRARGLPRGAGAGRAGRDAARPRWSCTPGSRSCPPTAPTGTTSSAPPRRAPSWPSARASWASCASPTRCAGSCAGARAGSRRPPCSSIRRTSWPSRSAGPRSPSRRCSAWPSRCATRGDYASATDALDRAIDVCERAGLLAQSIQATAARAVVLSLSQRPERGGRGRPRGRRAGRADALPDRPRGGPGGARRLRRRAARGRGAARRGGRGLAELDRPLEAARCGCWPARRW